jgi:hypothetical protein
MSVTANCPNCGAPIRFRWSSAVQTVCEFCHSILVRRDVNLERVGVVADLPPDSSPIQIATEGIYGNRAFQVVGRILYEYEQGGWNEWHAQAEYAVSFQATIAGLPAAASVQRGRRYGFNGVQYEVTCLTRAHYRGVEGELPFEYWDKDEVLFADLEGRDARFATLDYSDPQPALYLGEMVDFDSLRLKNLRRFEGW